MVQTLSGLSIVLFLTVGNDEEDHLKKRIYRDVWQFLQNILELYDNPKKDTEPPPVQRMRNALPSKLLSDVSSIVTNKYSGTAYHFQPNMIREIS